VSEATNVDFFWVGYGVGCLVQTVVLIVFDYFRR